jgi:streptomycin 6-kinase
MPRVVCIPDTFAHTIADLHGAAGCAWLGCLPALVEQYARQWSLVVLPPFGNCSYNYVVPVVRADGTDAVLKAGFPGPELYTEIDALRIYAGRGSVQLFETSREQGLFLLERLKPGTPLSTEHDDRRATSVAASLMRQLHRPAPHKHTFPSVGEWAQGLRRLRDRFEDGTGPFPARLVETAERLFTELLGSMTASVLLHGDLHPGNVLAAERQPWLAIDPKGVIGEPEYEVGALLRDPVSGLQAGPSPKQVLARRVDQIVDEMGFDRARTIGWAVAQAMLSAWWSFEDHGRDWEWAVSCAELLMQLE